MLNVQSLCAGYGAAQVLHDVALRVGAGEVVSLLGRNGVGKTTFIRTLMGLVRAQSGVVRFDGSDLHNRPPYVIARAGLGLVPEGRQVFTRLSVEENLMAIAANPCAMPMPWTLARVYDLFPRLGERRRQSAATLSGGEQQMVAIARALMINPRLLILDEATEGLAPLIRRDIWACLRRLKEQGQSILIVDRNLDALMALADRHYVMEKGQIRWSGTSHELAGQREFIEARVGI
jgi:branched-chain amino acid transport system ATP-binding protein